MPDRSIPTRLTGGGTPLHPDTTTEDVTIDIRSEPNTDPIPFVDMSAVNGPVLSEMKAAIADVLDRGDFVLGGAVADFETAFAEYTGTEHAIGVDSGFSALELLLRAHGIGRGDEVITVANTFFATAMAIRATGATPVLVDMDPDTHLIDAVAIEGALSQRTRAIIPVHLYGRVVDMEPINRIARDNGLVVVEDACQAHGAGARGDRAGSLGDGAAFSFYPSKNLGAVGDGGIVTTDDDDIAERVRMLRNLGTTARYHHEIAGYNRRLDTVHAAALSVKLPHLDSDNRERRATAALYNDLLQGLPLRTPRMANRHIFHLYVIETDQRDDLARHLASESIASGIHYPVPIHLQPAFSDLGWRQGHFPRAERAAERILSLPIYPRMERRATERVANAVRRFFE